MHAKLVLLVLACLIVPVLGQDKPEGPKNEKAQKTYRQALDYLQKHMVALAIESFKKADKQDGGHCLPCQENTVRYAIEIADWKTAETAAAQMAANAQGDRDVGVAHYRLGVVLMKEASYTHRNELFARAHEELTKALAAAANVPEAAFADGKVLAQMKQDDAAKAQFERFVTMMPAADPDRQRAIRYINRPELARARMAPPFAVVTSDGQYISLDDLAGKVVLIHFWATLCKACRETVPRIREIAKRFQGQPFVLLSVSLDTNEDKWKDFITKNGMTWSQYRDPDGSTGRMARLFAVPMIPYAFTIDADGVLQGEYIGDPSLEGKLKKLVARAREIQLADKPQQ